MAKQAHSSVEAIQLIGSWLENVFVGTFLAFSICFPAFSVEIQACVINVHH